MGTRRERRASGTVSRPRAAPGPCAHHWQIETAVHDGLSWGICSVCGERREHIASWDRLPGCYRLGLASTPAEPHIDTWLAECGLYDGRRQL